MDREGNASILLNGTSSGSSYVMSKFGIGTSTPSTALTVVGTSTSDGIKITSLTNMFLATDANGNVIATTSPLSIMSANYVSTSTLSNTL
jgi:hypothetical protein